MIINNKKYVRFYEGDVYVAFIKLFKIKDILVVEDQCYLPPEFFYFRNKDDYIEALTQQMIDKGITPSYTVMDFLKLYYQDINRLYHRLPKRIDILTKALDTIYNVLDSRSIHLIDATELYRLMQDTEKKLNEKLAELNDQERSSLEDAIYVAKKLLGYLT